MAHRRQFFDTRRGRRSLGFYELPISLFGYLQILLFPLVFALAFALPVYTGQYIYLVMILLAVPFNFALVFWTSGTLRTYARFLPVLTVLMCTTMAFEHITMWRALHMFVTGRTVSWTAWERRGLEGIPAGHPHVDVSVAGVPSVSIPRSIISALTAGHEKHPTMEDRVDIGLDDVLSSGRIASN